MKLKDFIKYILQKTLGYSTYLYVFARFKIRTLHLDAKEKDFFHFLTKIKKEGAILDIGANLGIMTYHLAKRFPDRKIHAFEPIPSNVSVLKKIIQKFKLQNVQLYDFALGEEKGNAEMILPQKNNVFFQGLSHVKHESITELNEGPTFSVKMEKLDALLEKETVAAIKIDVENFEYFVLKGAKNLLERDHPLVYAELWDNENRTLCLNLFQELSYQTYVIENNNFVLFQADKHSQQNFIFI